MPPINRREMLKLASITSIAALAPAAEAAQAEPATEHGTIPRWGLFEIALQGPADGNPFKDVSLQATFTLGHRTIDVRGFYDGDGIYKIRFMPDSEGEWT